MSDTQTSFWSNVNRIMQNYGIDHGQVELSQGSTGDYAIWEGATASDWGHIYVYGPRAGEMTRFNRHTSKHEDFYS